MDNKDIFEFCDDNLVYEINLKEAIERDYLVPFRYYGIFDDTDYGQIDFTRVEIFEGSDIKTSEFINLKRGYLGLILQLGDLEKEWIGTAAEMFLFEIETMNMSKLYKIPTLRAFIKQKLLSPKTTADEIAQSLKNFYENPRHSIDMKDASSKDYLSWTLRKYRALAIKMPIKHLSKSSDYFTYDEINKEMYISEEILKFNSPLFVKHIEDILEYRLRDKCAKLYKKGV